MSGFYKNVMHLLKGNVFYHLVTIASLIFLAKLQSPKVLGEYALFFSSVTILGSLFTGRLELALVSLKEYFF